MHMRHVYEASCNNYSCHKLKLIMKLLKSIQFLIHINVLHVLGLDTHSLNTGVHHSEYTKAVTCILYHKSAPKEATY